MNDYINLLLRKVLHVSAIMGGVISLEILTPLSETVQLFIVVFWSLYSHWRIFAMKKRTMMTEAMTKTMKMIKIILNTEMRGKVLRRKSHVHVRNKPLILLKQIL